MVTSRDASALQLLSLCTSCAAAPGSLTITWSSRSSASRPSVFKRMAPASPAKAARSAAA